MVDKLILLLGSHPIAAKKARWTARTAARTATFPRPPWRGAERATYGATVGATGDATGGVSSSGEPGGPEKMTGKHCEYLRNR